ncbi:MAG: ATP-binding cassette domain-containing protein [Candidatus Bathyarchaeia archaeon]
MIEVRDITYTYPNGYTALRNVSLTIREGDFIAIMGENGAGKTTLIKHFNGLLKPTMGHVLVDSKDTRTVSVASLSRLVGIVFQNPDHQLFSETVRSEVAFALRNFGFDDETVERRVERILGMLDLSEYAEKSPFSLSGGERKRVALASVLSWDPKYVVLDEPTIGQDYRQKERLRMMLQQLLVQGKSVIMVSHDVEFVADCRPDIVLMAGGRIVAEGKAEEVLTNPGLLEKCSIIMPQVAQLMRMLDKHGLESRVIDVYSAVEVLKTLWRAV